MGRACCNYLKRGYGLFWNLFFLALVAGPAVLLIFFRIFVTDWVSAPFSQQPLSHWKTGLLYFVPIVLLGGGAASILVSNTFLAAGGSLHKQMLESLARAPMSFFASHPVGRLLNRFSKDTAVADSVLVKQLLMLFQVSKSELAHPVSLELDRLRLPHALGLPHSRIPLPCSASGSLGSRRSHAHRYHRLFALRRPQSLSHQLSLRCLSGQPPYDPGLPTECRSAPLF